MLFRSLGIGVDVIATSDDTPGQLATNRELWFSTTPGGFVSRQLRVISSSDDEQQISLGIYPLVVVDGEPTIDTTEASETAVWATIEPNNFVLAPRTNETITITYRPPSDAQVGSYEAYVQILVKGVSIAPPAVRLVLKLDRAASYVPASKRGRPLCGPRRTQNPSLRSR